MVDGMLPNSHTVFIMPPLRRFWLPCRPAFGIGVKATSPEEARGLADSVLAQYFPSSEITGVVEDVDVSTLVPTHVLPNAGPSSVDYS
jgi:hypothetical protein